MFPQHPESWPGANPVRKTTQPISLRLRLAALALGFFCGSALVYGQTTEVLTPVGTGSPDGTYYSIANAFDAQPGWNQTAPVGGDSGWTPCMAFWDTNGSVGYIDLGTDWANWRITQVWTKYMEWRYGDGCPYAQVWWDEDSDAVMGPHAVAETQINFNTQYHDGSGKWVRDLNASLPITPRGRYLMLKLPATYTGGYADSTEYVFIGYRNHVPMILQPYAWGNVDTYYNFEGAFDHPPTWDGVKPVGGDDGYFPVLAYDQGVGYIDLGPNWAKWRIQQTWTKYIPRSEPAVSYAEIWWDDDNDAINDGVPETVLNFNTHSNTGGGWFQDVDRTANPVVPRGRYLMFRAPANGTGSPNEYAFVGYTTDTPVNIPPLVNAGSDQSVQWTAYLHGTATDDGLPNPPGSLFVTWSQVSGPGVATFTGGNTIAPSVEFSVAGSYVLRLSVFDGEQVVSDEVTVTASQATANLTMPEMLAFDYGQLQLVDAVDCGDPNDPHPLIESAAGVSEVQTIMSRACRVLPNKLGGESGYFAYRLGVGKNLQAGKAYVLVVEYPEDKPRGVILLNRGCETTRTFFTGGTPGDALTNPYVPTNPSSMHFGLSREYRKAEQLFHLHDLYPDTIQPRDDDPVRTQTPADGFLVMVAQYTHDKIPLSAGAAAARIALYEAPANWASYAQQLTLPPDNLPRRHLFWREEMSDGHLGRGGIADPIDWYEWKAELAKFLGMNTFSTDLLEFGYNQGWSSAKYDGFFTAPPLSWKWEQILARFSEKGYGLDVLPYYEYAGSNAGPYALGSQKAARPLIGMNNGHDYTGIYWSEVMDVDITDDESAYNPYIDAQRLLDCTITSLQGTDGGRPVPFPQKDGPENYYTWSHLDPSQAGHWGYIDFGPNWANYRITQTWTRSTQFLAGGPTPFQALYWFSSRTAFAGGFVPPGAVAEPRLNFITQPQSGSESIWTRDTNVPVSNPIIPQGRYLVVQAGSPLSAALQFLIAGWIQGSGSTEIKTLPITAAGTVNPYPADLSLELVFDDQTTFNSGTTSFVGAWFRTRPSQIPIGFEDATRARFARDANNNISVSRAQLEADSGLLQSYYTWWNGRRRAFLNSLRDYLRTNVNPNAVVLYTADPTEQGVSPVGVSGVITDDPSAWAGISATTDYQSTVTNHVQLTSMLAPPGTYPRGDGTQEEFTHSFPPPDPAGYQGQNGVMMTHAFNKLYTVSDPTSWQAFRTGSGVAAIRHYCLNEDAIQDSHGVSPVGYFVSDADAAGPYVMIGEARAVAYGDPFYIGYLSSNSFNRLSPAYVRDFNANYLALPALASSVVNTAASDGEVVVRRIDAGASGSWLAIVNTSLQEKKDIVITLPVGGTVTDAVTGAALTVTNGTITLDMWPGRLKSVRIH